MPPATLKQRQTRSGAQFLIFDLPSAPKCHCGHAAVFVIGKSVKGNVYGIFSCPLGAGEDWREKCDFSQWLPREDDSR